MEKHNLSKLKKQDLINKKSGKAMSAEKDLSDKLDKGDKNFTDQTAQEGDKNYGGKIKLKPYTPKYVTTSKSDPSNGKLDAESNLSDKLNKGDKKFTDKTAQEADNRYGTNHSSSKGTKPATKDSNLASDMGGTKKMTNKPSIKGKSTPSNGKLSSEDSLSDSFTHLMSFGQFVNEAYDDGKGEKCEECGENPCECDIESSIDSEEE